MDETKILLERHEQRLKMLERDIKELQDIRSELKTMSETLVALSTEMKHISEHLVKNEKRIDLIENQPRQRMQQIMTAVISAVAGVVATVLLGCALG